MIDPTRASPTVSSFAKLVGAAPQGVAPWFTTGDYAEELVKLSGHGRSVTDVAGELRSVVSRARNAIISYRRDQADREIARLEAMSNAREGWDGYQASAVVQPTIALASELLRQFADQGLPIPVATMSPSGNAALFNAQGVYLDIELHTDNTISWLLQLPSGPEIETSEPYDGHARSLRIFDILRHAPGAVP